MAEYKDTLNLPQTDFPMKANLGEREPGFLQAWEKQKLYQQLLKKNKKGKRFVLHDGPPYANGHIHHGHILNKVLKDIVVKSRNMAGELCEFIPGWDCHGLPIELQVDKALGSKKAQMGPVAFRKECRKYANEFINIQREEFKRLGCLGDWENPYLTMSPEYEAMIARELGKFVEKGLLYRGKKPVYWCASCRTALAEAEVEYENHQAPSIYVKFRLQEEDQLRKRWHFNDLPVYVVIWTTTPWTLPANLGVALHPHFTYCAVKIGEEIWIVADGLLNKILEMLGSPECDVLVKFQAKEIENLHCRHPFLPRDSLIILGPHVTLEMGTGCVHTAPGHGYEDYEVGLKYGLQPFAPIDERGCFTKEVGCDWLEGVHVEKANQPIIEHLEKTGALAKKETVEHSYPHCGRCHHPIVFRATEQWFIPMENGGLRAKALKAIDHVEWIPSWGRNRIYGMLEARPDWCISRQRLWGVPIIAVICESCGEAVTDVKMVNKAADLFEKKGSDIWFELKVSEILPKGFACPRCKNSKSFQKEEDILDVWFDSGVSYVEVLEKRKQFPADLYLEGSDQHRGWFHTSLLTAIATRGVAPYKRVLTHGFVVDQDGKKLSKSAGNYIPPENVVKQFGAEMFRLWVATEDFRGDIGFSGDSLTHLTDGYRKIRNTCRYLLGNLYDFAPKKHSVPTGKMLELDRWALSVLNRVIREVREAYDSYAFHKVSQTLLRFCSVELSAVYLDILKDRLYTEAKDGLARRSAQTALFQILDAMVRLMAPVLSFTAEEVWQIMPNWSGKGDSVFLENFPEPKQEWDDTQLSDRWERFLKMRAVATKALELARKEKFIGNSLEAGVVLEAPQDQEHFLRSFGENLADLFIVSGVSFGTASGDFIHTAPEVVGFKVGVTKGTGSKCGRCWKVRPEVGENQQHPELCKRCINVL